MKESRCCYCGRYLFSCDFGGEFHIVIKCKGCLKTNAFSFAKVVFTATNLMVSEGRVV